MLKIIAFYKYTRLEEPEKFKKEHLDFCNSLNLKGRILVAKEGINGSVSGTEEQIKTYKHALESNPLFSGIEFKEDECLMHPFNKMKIKVKPELVRFEQNITLENTGKHLSPEEFLNLANEENTIVLDARNHYESRVGKFKNALAPNIKTFKEFPQVAESIKDKKGKKILMYCTGGIRCEKASAFLKAQGFSNVYQLHGGILNFTKTLPQSDLWEGKCFVFDKRMLSEHNSEEKPISYCEICNTPCDLYKNCRNNECDKLTITCLECERSLGGCCSKKCFDILFMPNIKNEKTQENLFQE